MSTIANLAVGITANTRGLRTGLSRGTTAIKGFSTSILAAGRRMMGFGSMMTAAFAGAGMVALVKSQMSSIDAAAKLSDQLGVTTEDLSKLRHAAELTGAGTKSLDAGLATMAKRLGEAARGSGAAAPALEELGLAASDLIMMSPDKAFREIAGALETIEEPARRNAIAANLFSKANMGLLNTLAAGKDGLQAMGDEAERLGKTFSRSDAFGVEAANDAMEKLKVSITGVFQRVAVDLAPFIQVLAEGLTGWIGDLQENTKGVDGEVGSIAEGLLGCVDAAQGFYDAMSEVLKVARDLLGVVDLTADAFEFIAGGRGHGLKTTGGPSDLWSDKIRQKMIENRMAMTKVSDPLKLPDWKTKPADTLSQPVLSDLISELKAGSDGASLMARRSGSQFAGAALKGSAEAYSAALRHRYQQRQEDIAKKQLAETKRQTQTFEEFLAGWRDTAPEYVWIM